MIRRPLHSEVRLGDGPEVAAAASGRFRADPGLWLPPPATPIPDGHRVHLAMATTMPSPKVPVVVSIGPTLCPAPGLLVRSIGWRAEVAHDVFPVLRGDLEVWTRTEPTLRLVGSYTPPLSVLGALTDQVVGRHLATEVVRGFLAVVAHRLAAAWAPACDAGAGVP